MPFIMCFLKNIAKDSILSSRTVIFLFFGNIVLVFGNFFKDCSLRILYIIGNTEK